MFRKAIIGAFAVAIAAASPTVASARAGGGHHHGGFHGGGFHHHGGFPGAGIAAGAIGLGLGLATAPFAYGPYYNSYGYYGGGCYLAPRRVWTPYGWRVRRIEVCD